jgi:hypothetical protein
VAVIFFFAALWPAINFTYTATFQHAQYSLLLNGPLTKKDIETVLNVLGVPDSAYIGVHRTAVDRLSASNHVLYGIDCFFFKPADYQKTPLTFFSKGLLLRGAVDRPDAWGIDFMTAKQLGVGVGDRLELEQSLGDEQGNIVNLKQSGIVGAVYAPTNEVRGIIVPASREVSKLLSLDGIVGNDLFLKVGGESLEEAVRKIEALPASKEWLIETVPEAYLNGKLAVEQTINRHIRYAMIWASLLIYGIYILREQFLRLERRKKDLAILFSLGMEERKLHGLFLFEQLFLNISTAVFGFLVGKYFLQDILGVFIPRETYLFLGGYILLINLVVLALALAQLFIKLKKLPVAKLLTTE